MSGRIVVIASALAILPGAATAQFPPDSLVNIRVLPGSLSVREVIGVMREFALGLGVRCQYCHVGEEGQPLAEFDFPSDDKPTKRRARVMIEMMHDINEEQLARLPERRTPNVSVQCATCHRGNARPVMIQDLVIQAIDEEGIEAAKTKYRELREEYFGSFTYDFTEFTLSLAAQDLIGQERFDDAIGVLELNGEYYPDSFGIPYMLGEANRGKGDTARAIAHFERALELNPGFRQARARLNQLRGN